LSRPAHQYPLRGITHTIETVEKVSFQKLFLKRGDRNAESVWFCFPHNILVILKPVVGDFYEHFSKQGFFDSLVSPPREKKLNYDGSVQVNPSVADTLFE